MQNGQPSFSEFTATTQTVTSQDLAHFHPAVPREIASAAAGATFLKAMILHEDVPTGLRAKELVEGLEAEMETKAQINTDFWKLENLNHFEFHAMALESARDAQLLYLSVRGQQELSPVIRTWLDAWVRNRHAGSRALILSLDETAAGTPAANAISTYVRGITLGYDVMVFLHFEKASVDLMIRKSQNRDWLAAPAKATVSQAAYQPDSYFGWGLNE